jgi:hypothetical protein
VGITPAQQRGMPQDLSHRHVAQHPLVLIHALPIALDPGTRRSLPPVHRRVAPVSAADTGAATCRHATVMTEDTATLPPARSPTWRPPRLQLGMLHLPEQLGFHQQVHEVRAVGNGWGDRPSPRLGEAPTHDVAQDGRALPMDGACQLLQLGMRLGVQPGLVTDAVAPLARLRLRWVHDSPWPLTWW